MSLLDDLTTWINKPILTKDYIDHIYVNKDKKTVVVTFKDGTREKSMCAPGDDFDVKVGFAMCIARKLCGSNTQLNKLIANNVTYHNPQPKAEKEPKTNKRKESK